MATSTDRNIMRNIQDSETDEERYYDYLNDAESCFDLCAQIIQDYYYEKNRIVKHVVIDDRESDRPSLIANSKTGAFDSPLDPIVDEIMVSSEVIVRTYDTFSRILRRPEIFVSILNPSDEIPVEKSVAISGYCEAREYLLVNRPVSPARALLAYAFSRIAISYIYLHEASHILLGHSGYPHKDMTDHRAIEMDADCLATLFTDKFAQLDQVVTSVLKINIIQSTFEKDGDDFLWYTQQRIWMVAYSACVSFMLTDKDRHVPENTDDHPTMHTRRLFQQRLLLLHYQTKPYSDDLTDFMSRRNDTSGIDFIKDENPLEVFMLSVIASVYEDLTLIGFDDSFKEVDTILDLNEASAYETRDFVEIAKRIKRIGKLAPRLLNDQRFKENFGVDYYKMVEHYFDIMDGSFAESPHSH